MSDIAIKVENLSKRYRIGMKEQQADTLMGAMTGWLKAPLDNFRQLRKLSHFSGNGHDDPDTIYALKDVSFEVKQGEVVGIPSAALRTSIGCNGTGDVPHSQADISQAHVRLGYCASIRY